MQPQLPSARQVRAELAQLSHAQVQALSKASGVPFTTLWNVRSGTTKNPGIETCAQFLPHIEVVRSGRQSDTAGD